MRIDAGGSLDLAGHTLTCTGLHADGRMADSGDGTGLLRTEAPALAEENGVWLPLYDSAAGGWRLFRLLTNCRRTPKLLNGKVQFGFNFTFSNKAAYTLLQNGDSGLRVDFEIVSDGKTVRRCTFRDAVVQEYAKNYVEKKGNFALCAAFGDLSAWSGTDVFATPILCSAAGTVCRAGEALGRVRIP